MQVKKFDGADDLYEDASFEDMKEAIEDSLTESVTVYKPGAKFKSGGKTYITNDEGKFRRVRKKKRKDQKKSRKRNRSK